MARTRPGGRGPEAPARNDVYVGMLVLTCLSMSLGITLLALEADEYGWDSQPKGGPSITLPSLQPGPKADEPAPMAAAPKPAAAAVAAAAPSAVVTPTVAPKPAPVLDPLAIVVTAPVVPAANPEPAPQPGFSIPLPPVAATEKPTLPVPVVPPVGAPDLPPVKPIRN